MRSLTEKQINEIRELFASGTHNKKQLAELYQCHATTIALWLPEQSEYREYKIHLRRMKKDQCKQCGVKIINHKRCDDCTSLIHEGTRCKYCMLHRLAMRSL